jgi:type I restriction enzyme S subunit
MRNLDFRDYLRIRLPKPPLDEQSRIAVALRASEESRFTIDAELQAAKANVRAVHEALLQRGTVPQEFYTTEIGDLPVDWQVRRLREITQITSGIALNKDRAPSRNPYRYLTVTNVHRDRVRAGEPRYMELLPSEIPERLLRDGDIVLVEGHANRGEIGRAAMTGSEYEGFTFQNHLFRIRVTAQDIDRRFLLLALNAEYARRHWNAVSNTSSGLNTINAREVKRLPVPIPPLEEQVRIAEAVRAAKGAVRALEAKLTAVINVQRALRQQTLVGRLRLGTPSPV